jgi:hypothetical protein
MPNYRNGASADDAHELISSGAVTLTYTGATVDAAISSANPVGVRFPNITIDQGEVITQAILRSELLANYTGSGNINGVTLYGEDTDNAAAFTTTASDISNRVQTTSNVTNIGATVAQFTTNGINVTTIVQEILDRGGWSNGNAMAMLFIGDGTAADGFVRPYFWDYFSGTYYIRLEITYGPQTLTKTHTTDANKKKQFTKTHTTGSLLRKQFTKTHTTGSLSRKSNTRNHTTSANKRKAGTVSNTTDALIRDSNNLVHTTDAFLKKTNQLSHTADARLRVSATLSTDSFELSFGASSFEANHTTDALKRKQYSVVHSTDANKRKISTQSHTTDSLKYQVSTVSHTTNSSLQAQNQLTHTTDANKQRIYTTTHTTDSNKRIATERAHTADSLLRERSESTHTVDSFKRDRNEIAHTTDSLLRAPGSVAHTTDVNKKKTTTSTHTTDSYLGGLDYSRESVSALPAADTDLATLYTQTDRDNVSSDNEVYVCLEGIEYLVHLFKVKGPNSSGSFTVTSDLKAALAPTTSTVYLQVYNRNTELWETVDSNNAAAADTDFGLTANITSVADYYDGNSWLAFRIWQEII